MRGRTMPAMNVLRQKICSMLGSCSAASNWVIKSIHPMDHEPTPGDGRIPDQTTGNTVAPEGRLQATITPPTGLPDGATWDLDIWIPNCVDIPILYRFIQSGSVYPVGAWIILPVPSYRPGSIASDGSSQVNSSLVTLADTYRVTYKGVTTHLIANSLNDSGVIYMAQWADVPSNPNASSVSSQIDLPGLLYNKLPTSPDLLFQKTPRTITYEARKGGYMPMKYMQSVHEFQESANVGYLSYKDPAGAIQYVGVTPGAVSTLNPYAGVTGTSNFLSGMMLYRGLNSGASVQLTFRQRLEAIPTADQAWAPYSESSPLYDPVAMTRQIQISQRMADAYPADYNDLGKILKDVWGWIRGAGKAVGGMKIPFVSDIANIAGGAVDAIEGLF